MEARFILDSVHGGDYYYTCVLVFFVSLTEFLSILLYCILLYFVVLYCIFIDHTDFIIGNLLHEHDLIAMNR